MSPATLAPTAAYTGLPLLDSESPNRSPAFPEIIGRGLRRRTLLVQLPGTKWHSGSGLPPAPPRISPPRPPPKRRWRPWHLRPFVMGANIFALVAIAITLEVLLRVNQDAYGWETPSFYNKFPQIHIAWTVVPGMHAQRCTQVPAKLSTLVRPNRIFIRPTVVRCGSVHQTTSGPLHKHPSSMREPYRCTSQLTNVAHFSRTSTCLTTEYQRRKAFYLTTIIGANGWYGLRYVLHRDHSQGLLSSFDVLDVAQQTYHSTAHQFTRYSSRLCSSSIFVVSLPSAASREFYAATFKYNSA